MKESVYELRRPLPLQWYNYDTLWKSQYMRSVGHCRYNDIGTYDTKCCQLFPRQSGHNGQNILTRFLKIGPFKMTFFLSIYQYYTIFEPFQSKNLWKVYFSSSFIFCPFLWKFLPNPIPPMICPTTHFFNRLLLSYAAEHWPVLATLVHLLHKSSRKFHQLAARLLLSGQLYSSSITEQITPAGPVSPS